MSKDGQSDLTNDRTRFSWLLAECVRRLQSRKQTKSKTKFDPIEGIREFSDEVGRLCERNLSGHSPPFRFFFDPETPDAPTTIWKLAIAEPPGPGLASKGVCVAVLMEQKNDVKADGMRHSTASCTPSKDSQIHFELMLEALEQWQAWLEGPDAEMVFDPRQVVRKKKGKKNTTTHSPSNVELFKAALRKHHNYEKPPEEFNYKSISARGIEKLMDRRIKYPTARRVMIKYFTSVEQYKIACENGSIRERLTLLMGDVLKSVDPEILEHILQDKSKCE